jgi:hypothetical protein
MNNESKSNKLNEIFSSLKFNENQNYKKNKTSYNNSPKYNIIHLTKTCTKSASLNDIFTQKDLIEKNLIGHLYLKELDNSQNKKQKYFFIGSNRELNKLSFEKYTNYLWKNSYNGSKEMQDKNKHIFLKRTSMLPYLYRNLQKKKLAKKIKNIFSKSNKEFFQSNLRKLKMNSSYDNKSQEHFSDDISFHQSNISKKSIFNIYKNLVDKKDININIHKINGQKNNNGNKENIGNSFVINKTGKNEYQITLKKNNSQLFLKNMNNNDNFGYKKSGFLNINQFLKNSYFKENKRPDIKKISLDLINHNKISKEHMLNNNNALLDYGKSEKNSIKIIHVNNKPLIKNAKNYKKINIKEKNDEVINNSSKPIIMKCQNNNERIPALLNKNKNEGLEKENMEENYLVDEDKVDELDKIFNTNQINFFKFRQDIKEEPDLEEEID